MAAKPTKTPMTSSRERIIGVRLTDSEYDQVIQAARAEGLKPAQWLRRLALIGSSETRNQK